MSLRCSVGTEYLDHLEIFTSKPLWRSECRGKTVPFGPEIDCVGYSANGAEMREFQCCLLKNCEDIGWLGFWSEIETCTLIRLSVTLILEPLIWVIWIWKFGYGKWAPLLLLIQRPMSNENNVFVERFMSCFNFLGVFFPAGKWRVSLIPLKMNNNCDLESPNV